MNFPTITIVTAIIFLLTYAGISLGRIPGLRLDRAGIALTGAALMMAVGAITPDEAYHAVNLDTVALLLGMMIVVAHLRLSGFFRLATSWALALAHSPLILLATIALTAGAFSAFLVNDAVCLVMAPLVIEVTRSLRRDPIPYLLAVAMASNVGSAATITGNPQNMIVGAVSRIPYTEFAAALAPVALAGIVLVCCACGAMVPRIPPIHTTCCQAAIASDSQAAAHQSRAGYARRDRSILCRRAGRHGGVPWRRSVARYPLD
jgi:Na+/H+ antiporter NhaD/arsenite permease-like protein